MFNIARFNKVVIKRSECIEPLVIEGIEAYKALCPVSSVTGHRENPLKLLQTLATDPAKQRLLASVLQEVDVRSASPDLSNDDLIMLAGDNLSSGSFFESDIQAKKYMDVLGDYVNSRRVPSSDNNPVVEKHDVDKEIIDNA